MTPMPDGTSSTTNGASSRAMLGRMSATSQWSSTDGPCTASWSGRSAPGIVNLSAAEDQVTIDQAYRVGRYLGWNRRLVREGCGGYWACWANSAACGFALRLCPHQYSFLY